ncbi:MAG: Uma2 family endonuclease [Candidatus Parabeggiatoa sp.]|nr:Uma2 family endonuclease [Candidatus Parabeggiatoa sp.]
MIEATARATKSTEQIKQGEWRYEDYLNLPDDGRRYDIIEGILYISNAPNFDHQYTVMEIAFHLKSFVNQNQLGYVLTAPFEIHLSDKTRPVQPDVFFIGAERGLVRGAKYFNGPPDLVVEVLSPSTRRVDQLTKFRAYEKATVPEYWIVDPKARLVQLYTLEDQEYGLLGDFMGDEVIESKVLAGLKIMADSLFNHA